MASRAINFWNVGFTTTFSEREADHEAFIEEASPLGGEFLGAVNEDAVLIVRETPEREVLLHFSEPGFFLEFPLTSGPFAKDTGRICRDVLDALQLTIRRAEKIVFRLVA